MKINPVKALQEINEIDLANELKVISARLSEFAIDLTIYVNRNMNAPVYKKLYMPLIKKLVKDMKKGIYTRETAFKLFIDFIKKVIQDYIKYQSGGGMVPNFINLPKNEMKDLANYYIDEFEEDFKRGRL